MADPYHHAVSSAKKWGGTPEDYLKIHKWFDFSKTIVSCQAHRALRHHSEGIEMACEIFGQVIEISTGRKIPVRWIGEQHMHEDFGFVPSFADWARAVQPQAWMNRPKKIHITLEGNNEEAPRTQDV